MKKKIIIGVIVAVLVATGIGGTYFYLQKQKADRYSEAVELMKSGDYEQAMDIFGKMKDYENAESYYKECREKADLQEAEALLKKADFSGAKALYEKYELSDKVEECAIGLAKKLKSEDSNIENLPFL